MLAAIYCAAIIQDGDKILLTHDTKQRSNVKKWQLPERQPRGEEDMLLCIRRCILEQTGYRAETLRLYRIIHLPPGRGSKNPAIRFVFGCDVTPGQLQTPEREVQLAGPDEMMQLANKGLFEDKLILKIVNDFRAGLPPTIQPVI